MKEEYAININYGDTYHTKTLESCIAEANCGLGLFHFTFRPTGDSDSVQIVFLKEESLSE